MYIRNNVHLINMENFYFENVQLWQSKTDIIKISEKDFRKSAILMPKVNS
jgi:hypothetical protein